MSKKARQDLIALLSLLPENKVTKLYFLKCGQGAAPKIEKKSYDKGNLVDLTYFGGRKLQVETICPKKARQDLIARVPLLPENKVKKFYFKK